MSWLKLSSRLVSQPWSVTAIVPQAGECPTINSSFAQETQLPSHFTVLQFIAALTFFSTTMEEPQFEYLRLYDSSPDAGCPATSELLRAAGFMSVDSDCRMFRRFDGLRIFLLLRLQHRLVAMEGKLHVLGHEQDKRIANGETDAAKDRVLDDLALEIGRVLKDYGIV
jgi:hypothetical protein